MLTYNIKDITLLDINALIDLGERFNLKSEEDDIVEFSNLDEVRKESSEVFK